MPRGVGFYGSPTLVWEKGLSLSDTGADVVVVGYEAITPEMVEGCHREGVRIFADFAIFMGAGMAEQHPELWPIGENGKRIEKEGWYLGLCPTYEWLKEAKLKQIGDFLRQTPVDGVFLDFIRWPCYWEVPEPVIEQSCFCENSLSRFSIEEGVEIYGLTTRQKARYILQHYRQEWASWKAEEITGFVRRAAAVVKGARSKALLGLFVVPWRPEEYDNAIGEVICQDFPALAQSADIFSPMVYHAMCNREVEWVREYSSWLAGITGKPVWPIVQATNVPRAVPAEELTQVLKEAFSAPVSGLLVFTMEAVLQEPEKLKAVKEVFSDFDNKGGSQ